MEQQSPAYLNNKSNPSAEATPVLSFISMQRQGLEVMKPWYIGERAKKLIKKALLCQSKHYLAKLSFCPSLV
jgi:hypothetical protein